MKIIAELGINHRGSSDVAEQLIDIAAEAGAWAAKFQYRAKEGFYQATTEIGDEILSREIDDCYIAPETVLQLAGRIRDKGMAAGISFFKFEDAADFGDRIQDFDFFKVPSAELLNEELIFAMAGLGKPLILSTGGHGEDDIFRALEATSSIPDITYLHCISNYPVLLGNQQMRFIQTLREKTDAPVGYSTHDQDWEVCLIAAANGATVFERHLTMDKHGRGIDDSSSSDPEEFRRMCKLLNAYETVQGAGRREINQGERINMQNLGSSLYASRDIAPGEALTAANTVVKAPRKGLTWADVKRRGEAKVKRAVPAGTAIAELHFTEAKAPLEQALVDFCDDKQLSIPLRLHDAKVLQTRFPIRNNELHLSYEEVGAFGSGMAENLARLDLTRHYSIHIPDYIDSKTLIDPLAGDERTRDGSRQIITTCVDLALELERTTGAAVPIVGSFSRLLPEGKKLTYQRLQECLGEIGRKRGAPIYPQWLPRIAWYFGGADVLDMFCGEDDIDIVVEIGMELCLDLSHLILSANYSKADWRSWCERLMPLARHIHIADAVGIDGEGIEFGQGDLGDPAAYLDGPQRKVLEVWQGHLSEGDGFDNAIRQLGSLNN
ncbi:N-acetylneuraminate synthase family protein [Roseibium sediminicola]|uniref:N-acetylneuraminate synthase family protein n=1 Tax=Roseibium sediminicola TaxID=2933272 RepID=A0ABT0GXX2_9HYPH|nr:N-acetylneuraminate synthase family protein [Roseibium sp. CAU 1639]MCK7614288.1 N-acetylneuraminate synthase family protein [Roseibium sp. CAU 1639]